MESDVPSTRSAALLTHTKAASDTTNLFLPQMGGLDVKNECI